MTFILFFVVLKLSKTLKQLGASTPFDKKKADFSGMSENKLKSGLFISKVIHKAFVEVNEEGTEAAAATAVLFGLKSAGARPLPPPPEEFYCDRPFIFLIHEKNTNTVLFLGKFVKP